MRDLALVGYIEATDFIIAFRSLRDKKGIPLHILGMDYYKGDWNGFSPDRLQSIPRISFRIMNCGLVIL